MSMWEKREGGQLPPLKNAQVAEIFMQLASSERMLSPYTHLRSRRASGAFTQVLYHLSHARVILSRIDEVTYAKENPD